MEREYTIWGLDTWDESIEENNAAGSCLTREFAEYQENISSGTNYSVWISGSYKMDISKILNHLWDREEVDQFVILHPETAFHTFKLNKPYESGNHDWCRGYLEYSPIAAKREELLKDILDEN